MASQGKGGKGSGSRRPKGGLIIERLEVKSGKGRWKTKAAIYAPDGGPDTTILSGSIEAEKIVDAGGDIEVNIRDTDMKKPD